MGTAVPHGGTGGSPRLVPTPGRRGEAALWTPSCGLCWVQRGSPSPNTFCVPGTGRHDFRARGAPPTQPLPLPADQASRARPRSAAPWTAPSSRRARARRPGPGGLQRGRRLVRAGGGPALANPAQQGEALQATGRGEEPPARLRSGGGGGGGTRGEITPERCRFRLKMLPAMGVHMECLSWWGMHVDAPGICRALYPHPTGAHICTRPQSHPHSSGLRVELVKTSQPVERAHGREGPGGGWPQPGGCPRPGCPLSHTHRPGLLVSQLFFWAPDWSRQPSSSLTLSMVLLGSSCTPQPH